MPPRGVKKGSKRDRQYKEIKKSEEEDYPIGKTLAVGSTRAVGPDPAY